MKKVSPVILCENYNNCSTSINDLKYTQLDILFKINHISHRALLPAFLVDKGFLVKNDKKWTYTALKVNHKPEKVPVEIFNQFVEYVDEYIKKHQPKEKAPPTDKNKGLGLPLNEIVSRQTNSHKHTDIAVSKKIDFSDNHEIDVSHNEKFNLIKEVIGNNDISDISKKALLKIFNTNL